MSQRKRIRVALVVGLLAANLAVAVGPAAAHHDHAAETGRDGYCVVLAQNGNEKYVSLPDAVFENNENIRRAADWQANPARRHPLHVLVHFGKPGEQRGIWVYPGEAANHCEVFVNER